MGKYSIFFVASMLIFGSAWLFSLEGGPADSPISGVDENVEGFDEFEQDEEGDFSISGLLDRLYNFIGLFTNLGSEYAMVTALFILPLLVIVLVYIIDTGKDIIPFT